MAVSERHNRLLRRESAEPSPNGTNTTDEYAGPARLGRRTKHLTKRLKPQDIAIIDHRDIDRISAEELIASKVRCVINVAQSSTGEYPNVGPMMLVDAGVELIDLSDFDLFDLLADGDQITVRAGTIFHDDAALAHGTVQTRELVVARYEEAKREVGRALEAFAENTMNHVLAERELLSGQLDFPPMETVFRDRHVLIVVRGVDHQRDLRALRSYIRDLKPLLIAVDGGGQAILEAGLQPDMVIGDMDSAQDDLLRCGAELVVHAYPDGRAPGKERLDQLDLPYKIIPAPGTSEDIAMLLAAEEGAALIVTVGSHFNLVEFLDKNRKGMSSTFLTRLRIGEILVDAKGVSRLYRPTPHVLTLVAVLAAGVAALVVAVLASPALSDVSDLFWLKLKVLIGVD